MILNGLHGHFTLNFHHYDLTLRVITYLFTVEFVYIHLTSRDVRKRSSGPWSAYYLLRIFPRRYIVGTL